MKKIVSVITSICIASQATVSPILAMDNRNNFISTSENSTRHISQEDRETVINLICAIRRISNTRNFDNAIRNVFLESGLWGRLLLNGWNQHDLKCLLGTVAILLEHGPTPEQSETFDIECGREFITQLKEVLNGIYTFLNNNR